MSTLGLFGPDDEALDDGLPPSLPLAFAVRRQKKPYNGTSFEAGDTSVLPRARDAAASVPASPVEQSRVLPQTAAARSPTLGGLAAGYDTQINEYQKQLQDVSRDPDYGALAQQARQRGAQGVGMMGAALAAGMGPRDLQPLQKDFAAQSAHLMQPQKIEGGEVDVSGAVRLDPGFKRQKQMESLRESIAALEKQKLTAVSTEERLRADQLQREQLQEFRKMQLEMQREANADRAANARAMIELRRDALDAKNGTMSVKDKAQIEDRMGDDFRAETKDLRTELDATRKVAALPTERRLNPIEQQSAIVLLNKFLDPGSVVREGEFDRTARAMGMIDRAQVYLSKIATGDILPPRIIQEIRDMAALYEKASTSRIHTISQSYVDRSGRRGLDARNVVGVWVPPEPGAPGAAPGAGGDVNARKRSYYGQ